MQPVTSYIHTIKSHESELMDMVIILVPLYVFQPKCNQSPIKLPCALSPLVTSSNEVYFSGGDWKVPPSTEKLWGRNVTGTS